MPIPARFLGVLLAAALSARASGQIVSLTADLLDPTDAGYEEPPFSRFIIDVHVDVASTDVWTAAGIRFVTTTDRARIVFAGADDPNIPQPDQIINPGFENRFTTSLSKPRANRNGTARFENAGVAIAGRYSWTGPVAVANDHELNVAYFASPPENPNSPSADGYIARIAVDVDPFAWYPPWLFEVRLSQVPHMPVLMLGQIEPAFGDDAVGGIGVGTYDQPSIVGGNWYLYVGYVPEPSALSLSLLLVPALRRRG